MPAFEKVLAGFMFFGCVVLPISGLLAIALLH